MAKMLNAGPGIPNNLTATVISTGQRPGGPPRKSDTIHERIRTMSCCSKSKFVVGAAIVGLGVAALFATGVAPALCHRVVAKFEKQIPPEVQIEQLKIDISKLDSDIDRNWGPIATYEREMKE